jgi:hypothetical protein
MNEYYTTFQDDYNDIELSEIDFKSKIKLINHNNKLTLICHGVETSITSDITSDNLCKFYINETSDG